MLDPSLPLPHPQDVAPPAIEPQPKPEKPTEPSGATPALSVSPANETGEEGATVENEVCAPPAVTDGQAAQVGMCDAAKSQKKEGEEKEMIAGEEEKVMAEEEQEETEEEKREEEKKEEPGTEQDRKAEKEESSRHASSRWSSRPAEAETPGAKRPLGEPDLREERRRRRFSGQGEQDESSYTLTILVPNEAMGLLIGRGTCRREGERSGGVTLTEARSDGGLWELWGRGRAVGPRAGRPRDAC